jgi:hypothetical protein
MTILGCDGEGAVVAAAIARSLAFPVGLLKRNLKSAFSNDLVACPGGTLAYPVKT